MLEQITHEHCQAACGFAPRNALYKPLCPNKYLPQTKKPGLLTAKAKAKPKLGDDFSADNIVEISDDDATLAVSCSKKSCRTNPNCLNYLGQSKWNDEGTLIGYVIIAILMVQMQHELETPGSKPPSWARIHRSVQGMSPLGSQSDLRLISYLLDVDLFSLMNLFL